MSNQDPLKVPAVPDPPRPPELDEKDEAEGEEVSLCIEIEWRKGVSKNKKKEEVLRDLENHNKHNNIGVGVDVATAAAVAVVAEDEDDGVLLLQIPSDLNLNDSSDPQMLGSSTCTN
jgi:hypothetical protein